MPKKVAIVEDEPELAALIEFNLGRHGYEALILGGTKGTLRALEQAKPDLILMDVMLPDVDGFELCRQIRQSAVLARVKAHLRREEMDAEPPPAAIGPFRLDRTARRVFLGEREISLTSTEFNLLEFFMTHPGRAY